VVIGTWQILIIAYVLFIALGPRRVMRWWRWTSNASARLRGKPLPPARKPRGWLRAIELFEYSTQIGWACLALGAALSMLALATDGWPLWKGLALGLGVLLLFVAPWLI
jgi:hypothetical protein